MFFDHLSNAIWLIVRISRCCSSASLASTDRMSGGRVKSKGCVSSRIREYASRLPGSSRCDRSTQRSDKDAEGNTTWRKNVDLKARLSATFLSLFWTVREDDSLTKSG